MRKGIAMGLAALALGACGGAAVTAEIARYDLGPAGAAAAPALPLAALDVQAASWLAGPEMHYRLSYAEPLQRRAYQESRWAAAPAELLAGLLQRRLGAGQGGGCRLQITLDELEQRFDDAQASRVALELRAALLPARGNDALARRSFVVQKPAPTADARGAAAAARDATLALADDLAAWGKELAGARATALDRCRN